MPQSVPQLSQADQRLLARRYRAVEVTLIGRHDSQSPNRRGEPPGVPHRARERQPALQARPRAGKFAAYPCAEGLDDAGAGRGDGRSLVEPRQRRRPALAPLVEVAADAKELTQPSEQPQLGLRAIRLGVAPVQGGTEIRQLALQPLHPRFGLRPAQAPLALLR